MLGMRKVLAKYIDQRCLSVHCAIELLAAQTDRMMTVSAKERERERGRGGGGGGVLLLSCDSAGC